jgi:superfamily II DNA helicase RecQ
MRAKVLTLRFSPQLGRFDDGELIALQRRVVLENVREHVVTTGGETMLACVAVWQERTGAVPTPDEPQRHAPPPPQQTSAPTSKTDAPQPDAPAPAGGPATPLEQLRAEFTAEQRVLFDHVRRWRARTAHDEGAPAYVVLTNRQLVEIVRQRPHSKAALGAIHGLGDKKIGRYGEQLLAVLWPDAPHAEAPADRATAAAEATS